MLNGTMRVSNHKRPKPSIQTIAQKMRQRTDAKKTVRQEQKSRNEQTEGDRNRWIQGRKMMQTKERLKLRHELHHVQNRSVET